MQLRHHVRRLGHRGDDVVGEVARVRAGEPDPLQPVDRAARAQQLAEREPVAERAAVGVDVLAEQGDLDDAGLHERADLGEHVAGPPVGLDAAQARDDAERAAVVAADTDRHPGAERRVAPRRQVGRERLQRLDDLDLGLLVVPGPREQHRQRGEIVGAEHDVDPRRLLDDPAAVLLREAAAHRDLHVRVGGLGRGEVTQVAVEPVVGVLAHRAGVEHDEVGRPAGLGPHVAGLFEQPGQPFGVVHVHLAPVGADLVAADHLADEDTGRGLRIGLPISAKPVGRRR